MEGATKLPLSLPAAPKLTFGFFGASAIFTSLAIGSGELMFWPALVLSGGAGVLWVALVAVAAQWLINTEIARYSMATGESMVIGATRASKWLGVMLLLGAILPWVWPGWVRSGGQLAAGLFGLPEQIISAVMLTSCAVILSTPTRIYPLIEKLQASMLALQLGGVAILFTVVVASKGGLGAFVADFLTMRGTASALGDMMTSRDTAYFALLGGIVFAGAGGILNIGYGILICEKGFGMGRYAPGVAGIAHSRGLGSADHPILPPDTPDQRSAWRRWLKLVRIEHALLFLGGNIASILFISAIFFMMFAGATPETSGVSLLVDVFKRFGDHYGVWAAGLFAVVGIFVFYSSTLGILELTSRIAASILRALAGPQSLSISRWFHIVVWLQTLIGLGLIFVDPRQPFWLLATSAVFNTLVMAIYAMTVVWLNRTRLPRFTRPPSWISIAIVAVGVCYAAIFVLTLTKLV
ncbi:MAG: Nramp family divalent metal transporter [Hyphomonadaceae bacterium]|nr:Nramp family divalent metal transporter [Hyphomonadaceae bacterium]